MIRLCLAALALALAPLTAGAAEQTPPPAPSVVRIPAAGACPECGVVRSIRQIASAPPITAEERKETSGLVASVPLGGGKATVGSATEARAERHPSTVRYEIVVRLEDGRFQLVVQDSAAGLREGDKVRIERGRVLLREP